MNEEFLDFLGQLIGSQAGTQTRKSDDPIRHALDHALQTARRFTAMSKEEQAKEILRMHGIDTKPFTTEKLGDTDIEVEVFKGEGLRAVARQFKGTTDIAEKEALRSSLHLSKDAFIQITLRDVLLKLILDLYNKVQGSKTKESLKEIVRVVLDLMNLYAYKEDIIKYNIKNDDED